MDDLFKIILALLISNPQYDLTVEVNETEGGFQIVPNNVPWASTVILEKKLYGGEFQLVESKNQPVTDFYDDVALGSGVTVVYRLVYANDNFQWTSDEVSVTRI